MSPKAKKISKLEWGRHDKTIQYLYHVRRLPLHSEKGEASVQNVMHKEHNFFARPSQYEAYFKKSDQPKNLKKEEWRAVITKLDSLSALKIENRVKVSGHIVCKRRIERARHHVFQRHEKENHIISDELVLPESHRVMIEIRARNGEWQSYNGDDDIAALLLSPDLIPVISDPGASDSLDTILQGGNHFKSGHAFSLQSFPPVVENRNIWELGGLLSLEHTRENQALSLSRHNSPTSGMTGWNGLNDFNMALEMDWSVFHDHYMLENMAQCPPSLITSAYDPSFTSQHWGGDLMLAQSEAATLTMSRQDIHHECQSFDNLRNAHEGISALGSNHQLSTRLLVQSLLQDATQISNANSTSREAPKLPDPEDLLDNLVSLIPESQAQDGLDQTVKLGNNDILLDSTVSRALLFSITNNFAGLKNIPPRVILGMLRKQPQWRDGLFEYFQSRPNAVGRSLADNLFRAAVEACDEEAVKVILHTTRNSPNAFDPNEIVCKLGGESRRYTPIEFAAKSRHLGIVQTLLTANADVNKTYEEVVQGRELDPEGYDSRERGALELAIRKVVKQGEEYPAVNINLVRSLLNGSAKVRVDLVRAAILWRQEVVIEELIPRLLADDHRSFFEANRICGMIRRTMLENIVQRLDNDSASRIIESIFGCCETSNCERCPADHQPAMEVTLWHAARRENYQLVGFLMSYVQKKDAALSAAVRSGSRELIDLLIHHGASLSVSTLDLDKPGNFICIPTRWFMTPLSEAIRSRDDELVQRFESLGALTRIDRSEHFEPAICAAAEVGNCSYVRKLLDMVPQLRGEFLSKAMGAAIRNDETEIVLILIDSGPGVSPTFQIEENSILRNALEKRNKSVVEAILDADIGTERLCGALEAAVLWGDRDIVEHLIVMGFNLNEGLHLTPLVAAVKSRNVEMVKLLLDSGADPSGGFQGPGSANWSRPFERSPLKAAVEIENDDMIQLFIAHGADPADSDAFLSAIEDRPYGFRTLLECFCARYPRGKKTFGGSLLIKAVEKEDDFLLDTMLAAKFDVNSFVRHEILSSYEVTTVLGFVISTSKKKGTETRWIQKLIDAGSDSNGIVQRPPLTAEQGHFPALLLAISTRSTQMVEILLSNHAKVQRAAQRGVRRTPLQQACETGSFKMVELLLRWGAAVNEQPASWHGRTALQLAAMSGSTKIAELLLDRGADVHESPAKVDGRTALQGAAEKGCIGMIKFLWNKAGGVGFAPDEIESAIALARGNGHRGCAEYISFLSGAANFPMLQG